MTELKEFKLPDAGEGLTEADIVAWHVKPGDRVEDGQIIVEIETAKAVVELPSPWDGTVARLLAEEGQTVEVGVPIIAIEVAGAGGSPRVQPTVAASGQEKADYAERAGVPAQAPADSPGTDKPERHAVLVGYGVKASSTTRRARKTVTARGRGRRAPGDGRSTHRASGAGRTAGAAHRTRRTRGPRASQAAGTQAGQGPRHQPGRTGGQRPGRLDHPG